MTQNSCPYYQINLAVFAASGRSWQEAEVV
jgi:hypothetical protein